MTTIKRYLDELAVQRWDDHRYYHHSRINQSLHLVSALSFLCAYGLLFARFGAPDAVSRQTVVNQIAPHYPSDERVLNQELCRLLVYLNAADVAKTTLGLMEKSASQEEQMHYAYCLRALGRLEEAGRSRAGIHYRSLPRALARSNI